MKKLIIPLCFTLLVSHSFAQSTVRMTKDSLGFREKYDALASNTRIKQGKYALSVIKTGEILTTGYYKNNKKDGQWHEYANTGYVIVEGNYMNGKKTGVWSYYGKLWKLNNQYDFTKNQLLYHRATREDSTTYYKVIRGRDTINTLLQRPPIYLSGNEIMLRNLLYDLHYPPDATAKKISGQVIISFTVDEHGHARDYYVARGLGHGLDNEALRIVKSIPNDWVPGVLDGKPLPVILQLPILFKLR